MDGHQADWPTDMINGFISILCIHLKQFNEQHHVQNTHNLAVVFSQIASH